MTNSYHPSQKKEGKTLSQRSTWLLDIKEVITDIARGEADLDTLKAGASLIPAANEVMNGDLFLEYDEKYRVKEE